MSADREPAPVASVDSLTRTQVGDMHDAIKAARARSVYATETVREAFLRGIASQRDHCDRYHPKGPAA